MNKRINIKGILSTEKLWIKLFTFFCVVFFFTLLCSIVMVKITTLSLIASQTISSVVMFGLPAFVCAYLFDKKPLDFLRLNRLPNLVMLLGGILLLVVIQPIIDFTQIWNEKLLLQWLGNNSWIASFEATANNMLQSMLTVNDYNIVVGILILALVPAMVEELFFRGTIQRLLENKIGVHASVWITAVIFSAVHLQFFGFVPRMLLGALLGYVYAWSGSLWMSMLLHFLNNAMAVIMFYIYGVQVAQSFQSQGHIYDDGSGLIAFICLLLLIPLVKYIYKNRDKR